MTLRDITKNVDANECAAKASMLRVTDAFALYGVAYLVVYVLIGHGLATILSGWIVAFFLEIASTVLLGNTPVSRLFGCTLEFSSISWSRWSDSLWRALATFGGRGKTDNRGSLVIDKKLGIQCSCLPVSPGRTIVNLMILIGYFAFIVYLVSSIRPLFELVQ